MTLGIRQLAMFAFKNRQVVQIRIRVSHVEAVVYTGSLGSWQAVLCDTPKILAILDHFYHPELLQNSTEVRS